LARKLFFSYLAVAAAFVALTALWTTGMVRDFYLEQMAQDLEARARLIQHPVAALLEGEDPGRDAVQDLVTRLAHSVATRTTVILPSGLVVGDSHELPRKMDNHADRPEVRAAMTGRVGRKTRYSATLKKELMYVAVPLRRHDRTLAVVRTAIPLTAIDHTLAAIHTRIAVASLVMLALLAAVSLAIALEISRPLKALEAGAERFARGDLDHRLPNSRFEEIDALAGAMNRMAGQLHQRIDTILRQRQELEAVLASMQEAVLAVDNDGTIINLNHASADLLGAPPEELKGRLVHEVVRKPNLLDFVEKTLHGNQPIEQDLRLQDDQQRWLSAHGTPLRDPQNRQIGALAVLHDVTRLHRLESVRRDFVANVSHELKTPITSIKGFVETLLDGALDDHDNAVRFLRIVARQVNRLDAIIEDLLTLSRLEKGGQQPPQRLEPGSLVEVLQAAVEMCEKKALDKKIDLSLDCPPGLAALMNAPLLEQAVVNLVDNAIKYSHTGGHVRLTADCSPHDLTIRVQDDGCGIEPKHLARLFERFYRADKARSRQLGGTGLGLAIVKHIALVHQGSVDVQSIPGRGSTFSLHIPLSAHQDANRD